MVEKENKKVSEKKIKEVKEKKVKPVKVKTEKKVSEKKIKKEKSQNQKKFVPKKVQHTKRQLAYEEKKAKLAVKGRQTKWAPVWVVMKKYGTGKRIHPSATTAVRRHWKRTKLKIKPRRIRKWHMG
jgi:ribosomal protein L39E